jgi:hypothetical protein
MLKASNYAAETTVVHICGGTGGAGGAGGAQGGAGGVGGKGGDCNIPLVHQTWSISKALDTYNREATPDCPDALVRMALPPDSI